MTSHSYNTFMDQDVLQKLLKPSIERTKEVANNFYHQVLNKELRHQGAQTMSMQEIFHDYQVQVDHLNKRLRGAAMREKNLNNELDRIATNLYDSRKEADKLKDNLKEVTTNFEKLQSEFSTSDLTIKDLRD